MNVLHRDIKSANIFMSKDQGQIKLADMNVSIVTANGMAKTQTGTPYYASP
jgi:NIMA (never in mitosis gene a)-related kinase